MKSFALVLFLAATSTLLATGYGVGEIGVQGMGNAGAFVARAEDASSVFYNSAGLAKLKSAELAINFKMLSSKSFYSNPGQTTWDSETASNLSPEFMLAMKWRGMGLGIGSTKAYFHETFWQDKDFPGRFLSDGSSFETDIYSVAMATPIGEHFSVGFGLLFAKAESENRLVIPRPLNQDGTLVYEVLETQKTSGDDIGFHFGMQYVMGRRFTFGFNYQGKLETGLDGSSAYAIFTRETDIRAQNDFANHFVAGTANSTLVLPARITLGTTFHTTVRTRVEIDYSVENWSRVYSPAVEGRFTSAGAAQLPWKDVSTLRIGADFQQRRALLWRMGIMSSNTVIPTAALDGSFPDSDRFAYSFGVSYTFAKRYTLEAGLLFTQNRDREVSDQEYNIDFAQVPVLTSSGQTGLYETQRYAFDLGIRIKLD